MLRGKTNDMKFYLNFIFIFLFSINVFAQTEQKKEVSLPSQKIKERIVKQEFLDVPQNVRECHARGTFNFYVKVDAEGNLKSAKLISGLCKNANEYVEKAIVSWKFKVLEIEGKAVAFRGVLLISFCYGGFGDCDW